MTGDKDTQPLTNKIQTKIDNTTIRITNNNGKHIKRNRIRKKAENGYGVSSVDVAVVYY